MKRFSTLPAAPASSPFSTSPSSSGKRPRRSHARTRRDTQQDGEPAPVPSDATFGRGAATFGRDAATLATLRKHLAAPAPATMK
mmetsp:Transcript_13659/g.29474  ORF Transcript_13659/g.29474 Transcript_13659/m.29474 type:complete len:84 (+) Transcript_13659:720-971(+)